MHNKNRWEPLLRLTFAIIVLHGVVTLSDSPAFSTPQTSDTPTGNEVPASGAIAAFFSADGSEPVRAGRHYAVQGDFGAGVLKKKDAPASKAPDEVQNLKERILELQNKGKLGFRKIVACRSVERFGSYSPVEPGQTVDKVIFYCEPSNVSTLKSGDRYIIDCSVDFFLTDSSGRLLVGKKNALKMNRISRSPVMDLYFKVEMRLKKFLDRTVFLKTVLHDKIKNQTISVTTRINVEGGAKKKPSEI